MTRPKITQPEVEKYIHSAAQIVESVVIVGLRGYYKDSMGKKGENDRGIYDDAIILIAPGEYYKTFNANTDPSVYRKGIAKLVPGLHYYQRGQHGISRGKPYAAFIPNTPDFGLPVTRDGEEGIGRGIKINIHKGGYNTTSSEGCQTIHPEQWQEFQNKAYDLMAFFGQKRIPYLLVEL
jgi:lysozyme